MRIPVLDFVRHGSEMHLEQATSIDVALKSKSISSTEDVGAIGLERSKHWMVECVDTILLGRFNRVLGVMRTGVGDSQGITIHPDEVVKPVLFRVDCTAFIVAHYRVHDDVKPSEENIQAFRLIHAASCRSNHKLVDFVIVSPGGTSFSFDLHGYFDDLRGMEVDRTERIFDSASLSDADPDTTNTTGPAKDVNPTIRPLQFISEEAGSALPVEFDRENFFRTHRLVGVSRGLKRPPERQKSG